MHHYGRLKAVCLGTPADGEGWTIWKGRLCDNDAYCMSKCVWTQECICVAVLNINYTHPHHIHTHTKKKKKEKCYATNSTGFWRTFSMRHDIWNFHVSLCWKGFLYVYWSVIVYSNRCWLSEMQPARDSALSALHYTPLFSLQTFLRLKMW